MTAPHAKFELSENARTEREGERERKGFLSGTPKLNRFAFVAGMRRRKIDRLSCAVNGPAKSRGRVSVVGQELARTASRMASFRRLSILAGVEQGLPGILQVTLHRRLGKIGLALPNRLQDRQVILNPVLAKFAGSRIGVGAQP
jgi:hypothetical protein